jgi:hypothetical protein
VIESVASDPQGGAILIGRGHNVVDFGGSPHSMGMTIGQYIVARFSPSGTETDFDVHGESGGQLFGATDRAGNLHVWGDYRLPNFPTATLAINDGPALALGLPFFLSYSPAGRYRYGSSLMGYQNAVIDVALANDGTAWYAGMQRGALAIGNLLAPDPGEGGLLFRASPSGAIDLLRTYSGGIFHAVDIDERGRPVVAGKFRGGVDLGAGMITAGNPSTVVAKLNF